MALLHMRSLSVRARLTLWHAGAFALLVVAFSAGVYYVEKVRLYQDLDERINRDLAAIEKVYLQEPNELDELETQINILRFEVVEGTRVLYRTAAWTRAGLNRALQPGAMAHLSWSALGDDTYRVAQSDGPRFHIAVAHSEAPVQRSLATLAAILSVGVPCAILVAIAAGYFLAGRLLAPIGALAAQARRISAKSLGERLPVENPNDEFGELATVLNDAMGRVQQSFEQLRRFTADASHELRTPLASTRAVGEVALHTSLDAAGYRDVIGSMLEELERLTLLVDTLPALTRPDSGAIRLARERIELPTLAADIASQLGVLTEEKGQHLQLHADERVEVTGDAGILRQGIANLIHNAIKFTPAAGEIHVTVRKHLSTEASIEVQDSGPGISPRHRTRIFDRFYRVDDGRSRDQGGAGLGLAIARWAVEANGGRIEVESEEGRGSLFRIVLPLTV